MANYIQITWRSPMTLSDITGAFRAGFCGKTPESRSVLLNSTAIAMALMIGLAGPCAAQNAPSPQMPQPRDEKACAPQDNRQGTVGSSQNLSDKLERSEGVICPPRDVDPEIAMPPPGGGRTPVIPPPGSPGGDPTIRPK
jgi:hypothetical protein